MPEDYQDLVLATYKKMRDGGELYTILPKETTTRLRTACLKVYDSRYIPKEADILPNDADILSVFFEVDKMKCDDYRKVINDSEPDDFKALCNHIKGETGKTSEENTDLLAWLIDFQPRPSGIYYSTLVRGKDNGRGAGERKTKPNNLLTQQLFLTRYIVVSCIFLIFIGSIAFTIWENWSTTIRMPNPDEKYMYWDGDHYEPVKEGEQKAGVPTIKLNLQALKRQRRINLHDTMTNYSVGKVWHIKIGNNPEFYTDSGIHPVDTARRLRPMSSYVHTKYNSYPRYILTHLVWFICAAFLISICGFGVSRIKRKVSDEKNGHTTNDSLLHLSKTKLAQQ